MILSGQTIRSAIEEGRIGCDPLPEEEQYQPASLDVRLGNEIYDAFTDQRYTEDETIVLRPGGRLLGHTHGRFTIPNDCAAQLAGRSTLGRLFVTVHQTAGWIDPGYTGQITLEIANISTNVIELEPRQRVGQLVFFPLDRPADGYGGQYQGDSGPQPSGSL